MSKLFPYFKTQNIRYFIQTSDRDTDRHWLVDKQERHDGSESLTWDNYVIIEYCAQLKMIGHNGNILHKHLWYWLKTILMYSLAILMNYFFRENCQKSECISKHGLPRSSGRAFDWRLRGSVVLILHWPNVNISGQKTGTEILSQTRALLS